MPGTKSTPTKKPRSSFLPHAVIWIIAIAGGTAFAKFVYPEYVIPAIDPNRRAGQGSGRNARPRHSTGRWSLLRVDDQPADGNHRSGGMNQYRKFTQRSRHRCRP